MTDTDNCGSLTLEQAPRTTTELWGEMAVGLAGLLALCGCDELIVVTLNLEAKKEKERKEKKLSGMT